MACALLRFDFRYGDLIRWLVGGPYTNAHRDWEAFFEIAGALADAQPPPGFPPIDVPRAKRVCMEGIPLKANYVSNYDSCSHRNLAPISNDLREHSEDVDKKLRKEEQLSYHVLLPRFLDGFVVVSSYASFE